MKGPGTPVLVDCIGMLCVKNSLLYVNISKIYICAHIEK